MSAPTQKSSALKKRSWPVWATGLGLVLLTVAVFGQTATHDFVNLDDPDYISCNPMVTHGLTGRGLVWAFTQFHSANWHPLTWISHMVDCQIYGLRPGGHHLTNVAIHAATVVALFLVLRLLTGAMWQSAFVAAVFAIHPLRAESVAWIAERKDLLSGLFFVLTIGAYAGCVRRPNAARYGLTLLFLALGLMCKPMLVTLPMILLLLDYWPLQRKESLAKLTLEKTPMFGLSALSCMVTLLAQRVGLQSTDVYSVPLRLGNALVSGLIYFKQLFWPADLAVFYPYPRGGFPIWELALACGWIGAFTGVAIWQRRKRPWLLTGWFWYLIMLLPVIGFVQVGGQAHADRYTYLPQIGLCVALTWLAGEWIVSRAAAWTLASAVIIGLTICAWRQTAIWQNSQTLWVHAIACTSNNAFAHKNLGDFLYGMGKFDDAIAEFRSALQIKPDYADAHNSLGVALMDSGKLDEAADEFRTALEYRPGLTYANFNLGIVSFRQGRYDAAIDAFQNALKTNPNYAEARFSMGTAFLRLGRTEDAIGEYRQAIAINPDYMKAHLNLANVLAQTGNYKEAIGHFEKAQQLAPTNAIAFNSLAWLLATCPQTALRDGPRAVRLAEEANDMAEAKNPMYLHTLAAALAESGRFGEAVETVQKAIHLAQTAGQKDLVDRFSGELSHYRQKQPLTQ